VVNTDLLLKKLKIMGVSNDVIYLVSVCLKQRSYYVCIEGENSNLHDLLLGTIQGSNFRPVLFLIFISPILNVFADASFIPRWNASTPHLILVMEKSLESITKWLRQTGNKVNDDKIELGLFNSTDVAPIVI
jgi:hypothetical protein